MIEVRRGVAGALAVLLVLGALAGWLWPLGVGGRMPVGGDATRFSVGLMAEYDRALAERRIPLWNAHWGYGFPGLAESQMGVYYPPHVALYGLLGTEAAYTASLVLHALWAALGVLWAARWFGLSWAAGGLAAVSWAGSGFFAIHLAHPWAVTVGSWMPWAWGLAWGLSRSSGMSRIHNGFWLALVLSIQVLPGHFQLAFITQVSVGMLVLAGSAGGLRGRMVALAWLLGAGIIGMLLASAQLVPTFHLAMTAESDRNYDYLSGFSTPPPLLLSYLAPGLFHGSPLWRPIVWDPLHASPEEHLAYVGLLPLILAIGACWNRKKRTDTNFSSDTNFSCAARALAVVVVGTLLLSFGPYVPGFRWLIALPGFSFFRAPARWGVATQLALAMLAGVGVDQIRAGVWRSVPRSLVWGVLGSGLLVVAALGTVELVAVAAKAPGSSGASRALRALLDLRPWPTTPDELRRIREGISGPPRDGLVIEGLLRRGEDPGSARWDRDRGAIYAEELAPTVLVIVGILLAAGLGRLRPGWIVPALLVVSAVDIVGNGHLRRLVEPAPIAPLVEQSTVLGAMAALPEGSRVLAGLGNLPMVAGAGALESYRTLDRPIMGELTAMAAGARPGSESGATRAVGARLVVRPGVESGNDFRQIRDFTLSQWLYGRKGAARLGARGALYSLWEPTQTPALSWFLPGEGDFRAAVLAPGDGADRVLSALSGAMAVSVSSRVPEEVEATLNAPSPGLLLFTMLDDAEWEATASREGGPFAAMSIARAFASEKGAGWMAVRLAEPGRWDVRLRYRGDRAAVGRKITIGLGAVMLLGYGIGLLWAQRTGHAPGGRKEGGTR